MNITPLNIGSPWDYLDPSRFATGYDRMAVNVNTGLSHKQYQHGLEVGARYEQIQIDYRSIWSATSEWSSSRAVRSYESIGYNACTSDLLAGFLGADAAIVIIACDGGTTEIKPKGYWIRHEDSISPREMRYLIGMTGQGVEFFSSEYRSDIIEVIRKLKSEQQSVTPSLKGGA